MRTDRRRRRSAEAPDADTADRVTRVPQRRVSRRYSTAESLVSRTLTAQGSWPIRKSQSNRAIAFFTTIASQKKTESMHEAQDAVTVGRQYDEIMDRFQVRLRQNGSDRSLRSSISFKVQPADDGDTPMGSLSPPPTRGEPSVREKEPSHSVSEPQSSEQEITQDQLPLGANAPATARFSLRRWASKLAKRLRRASAARWQNLLVPMSPYSMIARVRSSVVVFFCFTFAVICPMEIAFYRTIPEWLNRIDDVVDITLVVDLVLMFNTSFVDKHGTMLSQRLDIIIHYCRGWFLPDLLAQLLIYWLQVINFEDTGHVKWYLYALDIAAHIHRLYRLLYAFNLAWFGHAGRSGKSIWNWFLYSRYSHLLRISWIIGLVLLLAHYMACFWKMLQVEESNASLVDDYAENFYGALQLLQGQGLSTVTVGQNLFASFAVLAGSIVLAIVFGHVAMLVSNFNANTTNYQRKMESVFAITSKMQLPGPLRERIHQYYEHLWREYDSLDGEIVNFSKDLTSNLTLEVVLFKYMVLVMHVPFWRECGRDFQKQIALHLKVRVYLPDDFIIRRGEVDDEFYVINRGFCEMDSDPDSFEHGTDPLSNYLDERENSFYTSDLISDAILSSRNQQPEDDPDYRLPRPTSNNLTQLCRGQAFGEVALLMNYERTANVRAVSYVEMCILTRSAFQEVLKKYPDDRRSVIMQILETFMDQNEAKRGLCPLKQIVHSVFNDGDSRNPINTKHAALLVAEVIDPKLQDETMMFGMDESLFQQLVAHKNGRQPNTGISPALEARLQRMEEAQAQTTEHLMQRIAHIDHALAQVTRLVQDHVVNQRDVVQAFAPANPQSPTFQATQAAASEPTNGTPDAVRSYRVRPHSASLSRLRSRSASMTTMQAISIAEDHPLHAPDPSDSVAPQAPTYEPSHPYMLGTSEPHRVLDAAPVSPEVKERYPLRARTGVSLQPRPVLLRQRSSSMTRLQDTILADGQLLGVPAQTDNPTPAKPRAAKALRARKSSKDFTDAAKTAEKQPERRRNSVAIDRASLPGLFGRVLGFSSDIPPQSPTPFADQFFQQRSPPH